MIVPYLGEKSKFANFIVPNIPTNISTYVEPFGGMMGIFFALDFTKYKDVDFIGSTVINNQGILGQIIYDESIAEILLLTDVSHVMPIISNNHFCNARGSGRPGVITCTYSKLIWPDPIEIGQEFFSSGMGGIYPSNILIGYVSSITSLDDTNINFDVHLVSDPLKSNFIGVLETL